MYSRSRLGYVFGKTSEREILNPFFIVLQYRRPSKPHGESESACTVVLTDALRIVFRGPSYALGFGIQINAEMDKFRQTAVGIEPELRTLEEANRSLSER